MANLEDSIDVLVDTIDGLTTLTAWRYDEDREIEGENESDTDSYIVVSVMDTGIKEILSINNFIGKRENPLYNDYGYLMVYRSYVRVITPTRSESREHATTIENYLKINYDTIDSDIVLRRHTFSTQKLFRISDVKVLYGVEFSFDLSFVNYWHDEPAQGAESQVIVDVIEIDEINQKDIKIRVSYD